MSRIQFIASLAALTLFVAACDEDESTDAGATADTGGAGADTTAGGSDAGDGTDTGGTGSDTGGTGDDTGSEPDVEEAVPCGAITFVGECNGDVLSFCDPQTDSLAEIDCGARTAADETTTATCGFVEEEYGYDCVFPVGAPCLGGTAEDPQLALCAGTEPGCVLTGTSATCTENVGVCAEPAEGADFVNTCSANLLTLSCQINQPVIYDCEALGGACGDGACNGLPDESNCDEDTFLCGDGLVCTDGTCVAG
jgi:hypothetical protein